MTKRKLGILALLLTLCGLAALAVAAQGGKSKGKADNVIVLKAQKTTTRGAEADPNIKSDSAVNDPKAQTDPPAAKGGPKTRGAAAGCRVEFDNRTRWVIKTYVDGRYRGTMDAFGDAYIYVLPGETKVYARADFDDGSVLSWGPKLYDCGSDQLIRFRMEY